MSQEIKGNSSQDDSDSFFNQLEGSVNGMVSEGKANENTHTEVTQSERGSEQVTHNESQGSNVAWDNESNPYKKRYKDSSREAVKMNNQLNELKPFVPVLDAMKRDSGLVDHVRDYLQNGGKPSKTIKETLNLSEDFQYDPTEAVENPDSESAQVMNAQINQAVNSRVNDVLKKEKANAMVQQKKRVQQKAEIDFIKSHSMTKEQYHDFKSEAQKRSLSLEDIYYLLNKDKTNKNVANSAKQDMLTQMKNVRNIPTSASDSNSQGVANTNPNDEIFDVLASSDGEMDDLFG